MTLATSVKELPKSAKMYFIGKNEHGEVDDCLKAYEAKYHVKPIAYVIYKQYLYIPHEEER